MGNKPVIVCIRMHNPVVPAEFEPYADAILVEFGVERQVLFDLITGKAEPEGRLPIQIPENMKTVEEHCEDTALDLISYRDRAGNVYDFGFGLNWNGVIRKEYPDNMHAAEEHRS